MKLISLISIFALLASNAFAVSKIQQQDITTHAICSAAGATDANCLPLDSQVYVGALGINQTLNSAITAGLIGGSGGGGVQLLSNASFENGTAATGWTFTTITGSANTTSVSAGKQSEDLTYSSSTGSIAQSVTPTPISTLNIPMEASCKVKTTVGVAEVCALVNGVKSGCTAASASGAFTYVPVNFQGPTDGTTIGVMVDVTSSTSGIVTIDDCYVGPARNGGSVQQAQLVGGVTITGCASGWTTTGTSYADFSTVSGCTYTPFGSAVAPSTNLPAVKFPSLGAGNYVIQYEGQYRINGSSTDTAYVQFWDGTNTAIENSQVITNANFVGVPGINQSITYASAQSNVTLSLRGKVSTGTVTASIYGTNTFPGVIKVYYFPTQSQQAYNPSQNPASWSGVHQNCTNWAFTSSTYADPGNPSSGSCALVQRTNRNFGTVTGYVATSGSTALPGIVFNPPRTGRYLVTASTALESAAASSSGAVLTDGSGNILSGSSRTGGSVGAVSASVSLIAYLDVTTTSSPYTVKIQVATTGGTGFISDTNFTNQTNVEWAITELDAPQSMPFLQGNVTSNTQGSEHIERASIATSCTSTPCTITSQSGSWLTSVSRASAGTYTMNILSGEFSATPTCTVVNGDGNNVAYGVIQASATSTSVPFDSYASSSSTLTDSRFNIICMGSH